MGFMITKRGIKANPEKIEAIRQMKPPTTRKTVQKLTGILASLNRFISKSAKKCLPFFKALKGSGNLEWGEEQAKAFEDLKQYIEKLAVMSNPSKKELLLYISTLAAAISAALVKEHEIEGALTQVPIYFVSEALNGVKIAILRNGEDGICGGHGSTHASILLPEPQNQGSNLFPTSGHV